MKLLNIFNKFSQNKERKSKIETSAPTLPNLLIPGFPKCGTHALLHNLGFHPDIYTHPDEARFFGKDNRSQKEYMALFQSSKKFNGEKSPSYILKEKAMRHISELTPNAKLFICLRHPVQALHSFYNFRVFEFKNNFPPGINPEEISFEDFVLNDLNIGNFNIHQYCYIKHIKENVLKFFPESQLYFVIQERMMSNMNTEMNKIFTHLGLGLCETEFVTRIKQHNDKFTYKHINYSAPNYRASLNKLIEMYKPYNKELFDFLGENIKEWKRFDKMYETILQSK